MDANDLVVDSAGMAVYRRHAAGSAAHFSTAAGLVESAEPTLLTPTFGLIGGDLLAAYGTAHAAHFSAVTQLSATLGSMSVAAGNAAATYADRDREHAAAVETALNQEREL